MIRLTFALLIGSVVQCLVSNGADAVDVDSRLVLHARSRVENAEQKGHFSIGYEKLEWDARKTAVVICDMWNEHWCRGATDRVGQMAPRMNEVVKEARRRGALIIHAPSGTLDQYQETPQRARARNAPKAEPKLPLRGWCHLDPKREAALPIDDSDGGCDCQPKCVTRRAWKRQIDTIEIMPPDAITDNAEAYSLLEHRGIDNLIVMGVHTNMCVLGRPFSIRQMVYQGKNVVLMRDMTDSMYDSQSRPKVSHIRGTELVVEHIEKYWCPTITSTDLLDTPAFRFSEDKRPHVAILVSDDHYQADKTLPSFAQMLREQHGCHVTVMHGLGTHDIPLTVELEAVDCLVLFVRRLALPSEQLAGVRKYLELGGSLVALRTASHAFDIHKTPPDGHAEWPEFDAEVLGGNYHGHGPNDAGTEVAILPEAASHPIFASIEPTKWHSPGSLYYTGPIDENATLLMTGSIDDRVEPLTWVRTYQNDSRIFYSALGHPDDFEQPAFRKMLVGAILWGLGSKGR